MNGNVTKAMELLLISSELTRLLNQVGSTIKDRSLVFNLGIIEYSENK